MTALPASALCSDHHRRRGGRWCGGQILPADPAGVKLGAFQLAALGEL